MDFPVPSPRRWYALLALPPLMWAGNALIGRALVGEIPPLALSFWRWVVALALLTPFTLGDVLAHRRVLVAHWRVLVAMGVLSITAYNSLLYLAVQTTTAINATLVGASMPLMILVLGRFLLNEAITLGQLGGILLSLAGLVLIVTHGEPARLAALTVTAGDGFMLLATFSWALYSVMLKRWPVPVGGPTLLTVLIAIGVTGILPFYVWELRHGSRLAGGWHAIGAILYTAVFASLAAYSLWNRGVAALGASIAGQYSNLVPVFTAVLGVTLLGEPFRWHHALAAALIFLGIFLAGRGRRVRRKVALDGPPCVG
ncbi:MAG: DMT family transporter [Magnetospirillum sp.]|nr:DMT family transporter [Magnetospirillum sp.]